MYTRLTIYAVLLRGAATALAVGPILAGPARAQSQAFSACFVPQVGAMYLIKRSGLPTACLSATHVEITWTERALGGTGSAETVARSDHTHALAGTGNTAVGVAALAVNSGAGNTAVGTNALDANTSGGNNTALGANALGTNTTAGANTAVGANALSNNIAADNTAVGAFALTANSVGASNTAMGRLALTLNTSGNTNTAIGAQALAANTSGSGNTALGTSALAGTTGGLDNTALGSNALAAGSSGSSNTAVGSNALVNSTGGGNIALGSGAGATLSSGNNNIYLGSPGVTSESGTIRLGGAGQTRAFVAGVRGVAVMTGLAVEVDAQGQLGTVASSRRLKEDIRDMGEASRGLLRLRPVTFRYIQPSADGSKPVQFGLIAEEVASEFPDLVAYGADGRPETVRYQLLPTLLLNEMLRQQVELDGLRRTLAAQAALLEELRTMLRPDRR